jgi:hypothetical protein
MAISPDSASARHKTTTRKRTAAREPARKRATGREMPEASKPAKDGDNRKR